MKIIQQFPYLSGEIDPDVTFFWLNSTRSLHIYRVKLTRNLHIYRVKLTRILHIYRVKLTRILYLSGKIDPDFIFFE